LVFYFYTIRLSSSGVYAGGNNCCYGGVCYHCICHLLTPQNKCLIFELSSIFNFIFSQSAKFITLQTNAGTYNQINWKLVPGTNARQTKV
jgi:hypothetical protein